MQEASLDGGLRVTRADSKSPRSRMPERPAVAVDLVGVEGQHLVEPDSRPLSAVSRTGSFTSSAPSWRTGRSAPASPTGHLASGIEVDFVLCDMQLALEAKSSERITRDHLTGLRSLVEDHPASADASWSAGSPGRAERTTGSRSCPPRPSCGGSGRGSSWRKRFPLLQEAEHRRSEGGGRLGPRHAPSRANRMERAQGSAAVCAEPPETAAPGNPATHPVRRGRPPRSGRSGPQAGGLPGFAASPGRRGTRLALQGGLAAMARPSTR
jgi:hypothetical protein